MVFRTDLAMEYVPRREQQQEERGACKITRLTHEGGRYVTVEMPPISDHSDSGEEVLSLLSGELAAFLKGEGTVLVVGIGNWDITPDALGPRFARSVLATRHIRGELARVTGLDGLRPVAVVAPGVLGNTGIEVQEMTAALCAALKPDVVVVADALAAKSLSRLGCTVQISDRGLAPGGGVGNRRPGLNAETLGAPVVSLGIPTVVEARTLAADLAGRDVEEQVSPRGAQMIVTPREIDLLVMRGARLLGMALNTALNPSLSVEDFGLLLD